MTEQFLNGFRSFFSAIFYRTNSYWNENMCYFWDEINSGWLNEYIYPYDHPDFPTLSKERQLRLAQKVETIILSPEDFDSLMKKINSPPDPEVVEKLKKFMNRKSPWDN